jgi:hypothetical protein
MANNLKQWQTVSHAASNRNKARNVPCVSYAGENWPSPHACVYDVPIRVQLAVVVRVRIRVLASTPAKIGKQRVGWVRSIQLPERLHAVVRFENL